jgi:hypothetical protein
MKMQLGVDPSSSFVRFFTTYPAAQGHHRSDIQVDNPATIQVGEAYQPKQFEKAGPPIVPTNVVPTIASTTASTAP